MLYYILNKLKEVIKFWFCYIKKIKPAINDQISYKIEQLTLP